VRFDLKAKNAYIAKEFTDMNVDLNKFYNRMQNLLSNEDGQDLIEYALVVALIALGATAGMSTVASDINSAFTNVGATLTSALA
jgi:pilus assembly protein Flp/PilA